jgi:hypothetical protein
MKNASMIRTAFRFSALLAAVLSAASPTIARADSSVPLNASYVQKELQNYYDILRAREDLLRRSQDLRGARINYRPKIQRKYVNSINDFFDHVVSHIERTVELASELKRLHPERYRDVDDELLRVFMNRHDFAKIEKEAKSGRRPFLNGLYRLYGRDFDTFSQEEKTLAFKYRALLNQKDAEHAMNFFKAYNHDNQFIDEHGKLTPLAEKFLEIERVADKTDRGLSPVSAEEFNRAKMQLGSVYIEDPTEKQLAESLEKSPRPGVPSPYERVTKGHSYEEFRSRNAKYANIGYTCVMNGIIEGTLEKDAILPQASVMHATSHFRH